MTNSLTVDLASKFTAWMVTDEKGNVHRQGDTRGMSPFAFAKELRQTAYEYNVKIILIEDVPYGIKGQFQTKPVLRLQGIILYALGAEWLDCTFFINPSTWQREFPGVARGEAQARVEAAAEHALALGYEPPNLVQDYIDSLPEGEKVLKKNTNPLAKNMTDYIDAYLMSEWLRRQEDFTTVSGVQPPSI